MDAVTMGMAVESDPTDALAWLALADALEESGGDGKRERDVARLLEAPKLGAKAARACKRAVGYLGRRVGVSAGASFRAFDVQWGGGSRNYFHPMALSAVMSAAPPSGERDLPRLTPREGDTVPLVPGQVVLERSYFRGELVRLTVHCHPSDLPSLAD